jgi:hypothetical protein
MDYHYSAACSLVPACEIFPFWEMRYLLVKNILKSIVEVTLTWSVDARYCGSQNTAAG